MKKVRFLCPNCNSKEGYFRIKTKEWVCRKCSKIGLIEEVKEDGGNN